MNSIHIKKFILLSIVLHIFVRQTNNKLSSNKKKIQVFVSSTYEDLKVERQAAVQAILESGHIPAGMELFTSGDQSQMEVIKNWIEDSDLFLLILGGRYGSIEPTTQKSYIHLEYEYADSLNKPFFAVVINEDALEKKVKKNGSSVIEKNEPSKLREFKKLVESKMVEFYEDTKDIKLAIHKAMSKFERRDKIIGWIRGDRGVNSSQLANEIARLTNENSKLRKRLDAQLSSGLMTFSNGLTFIEIFNFLVSNKLRNSSFSNYDQSKFKAINITFKFEELNLLHFFIMNIDDLYKNYVGGENSYIVEKLKKLGLVEQSKENKFLFGISEDGKRFYLQLLKEHNLNI